MGKIYIGQTKLRIQLTVNQNITDATAIIKYEKPGKKKGHFDATISNATTGVIHYDVVTESDLDEPGDWILWAYVTFSDQREAAGEPVKMAVYKQGT
jgi:hypothetical protein